MGRYVYQSNATFLRQFEILMTDLNHQLSNIRGMTLQGLVEFMNEVHRQTEVGSPVTPVLTGALVSSWFTKSKSKDLDIGTNFKITRPKGAMNIKGKPLKLKSISEGKRKKLETTHYGTLDWADVEIGDEDLIAIGGYSVPYAAYIHEGLAGHYKAQNWTRPGSGAGWLSKAFNGSKGNMVKIIKQNIKLK